jgi:hypothetical protein
VLRFAALGAQAPRLFGAIETGRSRRSRWRK